MFNTLLQVAVGNGTGLPPITVDSLLGDMTVLLVLSAVIVGIAWRTLGKYWDKWRDGEAVTFDRVFVGTAVAAFVGAITPALAIFPQASSIFAGSFGNYGLALSWIITMGWAYGLNEAVNYTYRRVEHKAEAKAILNLREEIPELDRLITEKMEKMADELKKEAQTRKTEEQVSPSPTASTPSSSAAGTEGKHEI